jgi:hypothetical protein
MSDYYEDDGPPAYNQADREGWRARRELTTRPSRASICTTCGQQHTQTGLWSVPGVPHTGWVCIATEDLGQIDETCQMCEREEIRFVQRTPSCSVATQTPTHTVR